MSKVSWKDIFCGVSITVFQLTVSINDLFSTNQENGTEMRFVAGATKINLKI